MMQNTTQMWIDRREPPTMLDLQIIRSMAEVCPMAELIVLAGEVSHETVGELAESSFITWADVSEGQGQSSLFVPTYQGTVRMRRYRHNLRHLLTAERKKALYTFEAERNGLKPWYIDKYPDYYMSMLVQAEALGKHVVMGHKWGEMYINGITIFNKPWFNDVPPSAFFCLYSLKDMDFLPLTKQEKKAVEACYRPEIAYLTNEEMAFLAYLQDKRTIKTSGPL